MKVLYAALLAASAAAAQSVDGTVIDSSTGAPVQGARVTFSVAGAVSYQATTDSQGAFHLRSLRSGTYIAELSKLGYLPSVRQTVTLASDAVRLDSRLIPYSRISGRVSDTTGKPVRNAELLLDGSRSGQTANTDDQGNFEFRAPPGIYVLSARPPRDLKPPPAGSDERLGWADTYYPGVADRGAATKISVQAGVDVWGQDLVLRTTRVHRVRGTLADSGGSPAPGVTIEASRTDQIVPEQIEAVTQPDGSFEFPALAEGPWRIFAEADAGRTKLRAFASTPLTRDMDRLELRLAPPFTLTGTIAFAGADGSSAPTKPASVFLRPLTPGEEGLSQATVNRDGTFRIDRVYPDAYKIVAAAPGSPYFLSSVRLGDREVLGQYIDLSAGTFPIKITFDSQGGGVHGTVEHCGSATVALAPQDEALRDVQFLYTAQCGDGDRFDFASVRPGDYFAFAFEQWSSPADLLSGLNQTLINQAVRVKVEQGRTENIDLRLTPHP